MLYAGCLPISTLVAVIFRRLARLRSGDGGLEYPQQPVRLIFPAIESQCLVIHRNRWIGAPIPDIIQGDGDIPRAAAAIESGLRRSGDLPYGFGFLREAYDGGGGAQQLHELVMKRDGSSLDVQVHVRIQLEAA